MCKRVFGKLCFHKLCFALYLFSLLCMCVCFKQSYAGFIHQQVFPLLPACCCAPFSTESGKGFSHLLSWNLLGVEVVVPVGSIYFIQSVPPELSMESHRGLQLAQKNSYMIVSDIKASLKWEETEPAWQVLKYLLKEGLTWLELQAPPPGEAHY